MAIHHFPRHSSNPLFSTILTLYVLILLYFPHLFLRLCLSPLFIYTLILLLSLLRLGVSQQNNAFDRVKPAQPGSDSQPIEAKVQPEAEETGTSTESELELQQQGRGRFDPTVRQGDEKAENPSTAAGPGPKPVPEPEKLGCPDQLGEEASRVCPCSVRLEPSPFWDPKRFCRETYVEWDVGAPLEVIYEAYEGEEEGNDDQNDALKEDCSVRIGRFLSLSRYYRESDLGSGLDSGSFLSFCDGEFPGIQRWDEEEEEEEEEREGLIEIDLDHDHEGMKKTLDLGQVDEEDNLIEIDISLIRINDGYSW